MEAVNRQTASALSTVGVPVSRKLYQGTAAAWITFELIHAQDINYHDDESDAVLYSYGADIFARTAPDELVDRVKAALKAADYYDVTVEAEQYESETGFYHVSLQFYYMEVV